ncbi:MAG: hypothetical protein Q9M35_09950 [Rhodothermus sp.]|nr:hypothetical protein [Rhodothermus sp.]
MGACLSRRAAGLLLLFLVSTVGLPTAHQLLHARQLAATCSIGNGLYQSPDCQHLPDPCHLYAGIRFLPTITTTVPVQWERWEKIPIADRSILYAFFSIAPDIRAPPV